MGEDDGADRARSAGREAMPGDGATMRVTTFNIHACVGTDGRRDPARVAAVLGAIRPDILAVQEVDLRSAHADPADLLDLIAAEAGERRYEAYTIETADRRYGIALYSRFDIHSVAVHDLSFRRREPRTAIDGTVETPAGPLRVIATHLGLSIGERAEQIARLAALVGAVPDRPTLLLGDFNDWRRPGRIGRVFDGPLPTQIAAPSFPSVLPTFALDRILLSAHLDGRLAPVATDPRASDHRPVSADIRFRAGLPSSGARIVA